MLLLMTMGTVCSGQVRAGPPPITDAVPADALAALFVMGLNPTSPADDTRSTFELAAFLADRAQRVGLLSKVDESIRCWIDSIAAAPAVMHHPCAVALFDFKARARPDGGHELAGLRGALIVNTGGADTALEWRIQHLLNTYTNSDETVLTKRVEAGRTVCTIQDVRLPPWATITWGRQGDYYIVALGNDVYDRVTGAIAGRSSRLATDGWFRNAFSKAGGTGASAALYVRFDKLRRTGDALLTSKIERVQAALRLTGSERGFWTVGLSGRAVEVGGVLRRGGRDEILALAGTRFLSAIGEPVIPDAATGFAAIDCNPRAVLRSAREAYLASKSPGAQQGSRAFWRSMEADAGVSVEEDIFAHLSGPIAIHNYPRHALGIPFAWTLLARITGDPTALQHNIDRLMIAADRRLAPESMVRLRKDHDGIWFARFGLAGPALAVTDKWLVVSFSPEAVRQNLDLLLPKPPAVHPSP